MSRRRPSTGPKARGGEIQRIHNQPRAITHLARKLVLLDPERIVVESTGGYERALVSRLAAMGLPIVVVNPRRVRSFGEGVGFLAKTDAIDARLLALFGEKAEPEIRPILQGRDRLLADLVARRRQLVGMLVAEKNRKEMAPAAVASTRQAPQARLHRHRQKTPRRHQRHRSRSNRVAGMIP